MDLTDTIIPKSDQLNAEDLLTGPRTFTVEKVTKGSAEQPVDIHLVEFPGRPFRPSKTVRRILVHAWGPEASAYVGRRMTLYRDPSVKFGGMDVGGIRVSHLSHIDKPLSVALTVSRGKRQPYTVKPLVETPAATEGGGNDVDRHAGHRDQGGITDAQLRKLGVMLKDYDRDARLALVSSILGRDVDSAKSLTQREASRCIDELTKAATA